MYRRHISFAGAGRVGGAICRELFNAGFIIDLIVSTNSARGKTIAGSCNSVWSDKPVFPDTSEIIIVAVPDQRLNEVLSSIKCSSDAMVFHTAGSFGLDIFPENIKKRGVFYPLQTFSNNRQINFKDLPFLIESQDDESLEAMKELAASLNSKFYIVDTERRRMLHLAAVFVCNFTNHMFTEGKDIAMKAGFPFQIFKALIEETVSKALAAGPEKSQTGPALRNDQNTIQIHLGLLSYSPELQTMYSGITQSIINYYKSRNSGQF